MGSILFDLKDGVLTVANKGQPFSRPGVISVCNMDLSAKSTSESSAPLDNYEGVADGKLVDEIARTKKKTYENDPNRIQRDKNAKEGVEKSYAGRFVLELLQNAEDAANMEQNKARLIGAKGLGFRSVTEITSEPEIYSGEFCFCFSEGKSREFLKEIMREHQEINDIPSFEIPHQIKPDKEIDRLRGNGYDTVIRLPIKAGQEDYVEDILLNFDIACLLFCEHLEFVEIRTEMETRSIAVRRNPIRGWRQVQCVELSENGNKEYWRVWRRTDEGVEGKKEVSVSICLPICDGKVTDYKEDMPLYVFFPTEAVVSNVRALIHASFEVESNREHLQKRQSNWEVIRRLTKDIMTDILLRLNPEVTLRAFGKARGAEGGDCWVDRLEGAIFETVRETAFIPVLGGHRVKPGDARTWEHDIEKVLQSNDDVVKCQNLCSRKVNRMKSILKNLRAHPMSSFEHATLLRHCRNATMKECLNVWEVAQLLMKQVPYEVSNDCAGELRLVPFWQTVGGRVRAIEGDIPLAKEKPIDCPKWLPVDVIDGSFLKSIERMGKRFQKKDSGWEDYLKRFNIYPLGSVQEYFDHILLPYCEKQPTAWWGGNGFEVLKTAMTWGRGYNKNDPLIIGSKPQTDMERRAKIIHLPVMGSPREWQPAIWCYAGSAWGGPKIFDSYFPNISDRFLLLPITEWEINNSGKDESHWKSILLWLGCSWMPKLCRINGLPQWLEHTNHYIEDYPKHGHKNFNFVFEHFDEMFSYQSCDMPLGDVISLDLCMAMYEISIRNKAMHHNRLGNPREIDSDAGFQLKETEFVPCAESFISPRKRFFSPKEAYFPGCSLSGFLPEIDEGWLRCIESKDGRDVRSQLGANNRIPEDKDKLVEYMRKLSECAEEDGADLHWNNEATSRIALAAEEIFKTYAAIQSDSGLGGDVKVPCIRHTRDGEKLYFHRADGVFWADEPYFDESEVRKNILNIKGLPIFFRFILYGEGFGLEKLSEHLKMKVSYRELDKDNTALLRERYKERRLGLMGAINRELEESLDFVAYRKLSMVSTVPVYKNIGPTITHWKENEGCRVAINSSSEGAMWDGLATALSEIAKCQQDKAKLEVLLLGDSKDFFRHLRNDYGLPEDSIAKMERLTVSQQDIADETEDNGYSVFSPRSPNTPSNRHQVEFPESEGDVGNYDRRRAGGLDPGLDENEVAEELPVPKIDVVVDTSEDNRYVERSRNNPGQGKNEASKNASNEDGRLAEKALYEWLCSKFGKDNVIDKNKYEPDYPGYDILVIQDREEHYYECKSFKDSRKPRHVEMSKTQYELAREKGKRYKLCVIYNRLADPVSMLEPIPDPAKLKSEPIVEKYKVHLTSHDGKTEH